MVAKLAVIIIAIVALVAIIILLWNKNEGFRNFVMAAWEMIKNAVKAVADWFVNTLWPALQAVWDGIVTGVKTMVALFVAYWTTVWNIVQAVWNGITTAIDVAVKFIWGLIVAYFNLYKAVITAVFNAVKAVVTAIWNGIKAVIAGARKAHHHAVAGQLVGPHPLECAQIAHAFGMGGQGGEGKQQKQRKRAQGLRQAQAERMSCGHHRFPQKGLIALKNFESQPSRLARLTGPLPA